MCVCVCVCVCVLDLWMLCFYVERCFESLTCWVDLCLSSLFVAFIFMCFSSLEKLIFFKLYGFSTNPRQILFLSSLLSLFSIDLDSFSIHQDFWVPAQHILDNFFDPLSQISMHSVCSIDSWQILNPSRHSFAVNKSSIAYR